MLTPHNMCSVEHHLCVWRAANNLLQNRHLLLEHVHHILINTAVGERGGERRGERGRGGGEVGEGICIEDHISWLEKVWCRAHPGYLSSSVIWSRRADTYCTTLDIGKRDGDFVT